MSATLPIGAVISSRYRIIANLGQGGMGLTYRAWDLSGNRPVVLKHPRREMLEKPGFMERFNREAWMMAALSHPHVVPITSIGDHEGMPYLTMPFLPGGSLLHHRRWSSKGRPLAMQPSTLHLWLPQMADALDYIHASGIVHRDVKPANVFFNGFWHAYLGDFGIAKILEGGAASAADQVLTTTSMMVGTSEYMAPEMFAPKAVVTGQADQYALAVMVYEILAGRRPYTGDKAHLIVEVTTQRVPHLGESRGDLPETLEAAVHRALSKRPEERFEDCRAFVRSALADVPVMRDEPGVARLVCPKCAGVLKLASTVAGRLGRCPHCKSQMMVAHDFSALWLLSEEAERSSYGSAVPTPLPVDAASVAAESEQDLPVQDLVTPASGGRTRSPRTDLWSGMTVPARMWTIAAVAAAAMCFEAVIVHHVSSSWSRVARDPVEPTSIIDQNTQSERPDREPVTVATDPPASVDENPTAPVVARSDITAEPIEEMRSVQVNLPRESQPQWQQFDTSWNGNAYSVVITELPISKSAAQYWCRHLGGTLVDIETAEELAFLTSFLREKGPPETQYRTGGAAPARAMFHTGGFRETGFDTHGWLWSTGVPADDVVSASGSHFTIDDWNQEGSELRVSGDGLSGFRARWADGFVCEYHDAGDVRGAAEPAAVADMPMETPHQDVVLVPSEAVHEEVLTPVRADTLRNSILQSVAGRNELVVREGGLFNAIVAAADSANELRNALTAQQIAQVDRNNASAQVAEEQRKTVLVGKQALGLQSAQNALAIADAILRQRQRDVAGAQTKNAALSARLTRDLPLFFKRYEDLRTLLPHERSPANAVIANALLSQVQLSEPFVDGYIVAAQALAYEGQEEEAAALLEKAFKVLNSCPGLVTSSLAEDYCAAWLLLGKPDRVGPYAAKLKNINVLQRTARQEWLLGAFEAANDRHKDAWKYLSSATTKAGRQPPAALVAEAAFSRVMSDVRGADPAEIEKLLQRVDDDTSWPVLRSRACVAAANGNWDEASRLIEQCRRKAPPRLDAELNEQGDTYKKEELWRRK